jgi:hypothetical protein
MLLKERLWIWSRDIGSLKYRHNLASFCEIKPLMHNHSGHSGFILVYPLEQLKCQYNLASFCQTYEGRVMRVRAHAAQVRTTAERLLDVINEFGFVLPKQLLRAYAAQVITIGAMMDPL